MDSTNRGSYTFIKAGLIFQIGLILYKTAVVQGAQADVQAYLCQGQNFSLACGNVGPSLVNASFAVKSLTIYAHTDAAIVSEERTTCIGSAPSQCFRTVDSLYDVGLSDDYKYFVAWFQAACNGKSRCQGRVPKWYEIIGKNTNCPQNGTNYFHKVLVHLTCDLNEAEPTVTEPLVTIPKTAPQVYTTTPSGSISVPFHQPELSDLERILIGVIIGAVVVIMMCTLILLYCCDRWKKKQAEKRLLQQIGEPTAREEAIYNDIEELPWDTNNEGAVREFTGAKPSEYIDHTLKANMGTDTYTSQVFIQAPVESGYNTPIPAPDYDCEENMELERRMAEDLNPNRLSVALEMATSKH